MYVSCSIFSPNLWTGFGTMSKYIQVQMHTTWYVTLFVLQRKMYSYTLSHPMFFLKRPFLGRRLQTVDNWNINKWQLKDIWKIYQKMHSFHTRGSLINTPMKISVIICCLTIVCSKNKSWDGRCGLWEGLGCTWPNLWGRHWQSIKPASDWPSAQVLEVVWFVGKMLWIRDVLGSIKKLVQNRYQGGQNHVSQAESAMAEYLQVPFALGLNSGGSAIFLALKLAGVSWYWWKVAGMGRYWWIAPDDFAIKPMSRWQWAPL